jgi:hypothetical protein
MSIEERDDDQILDRAISGIRNESIDPEAVRDAAGRVWARLSENAALSGDCEGVIRASGEELRSCADFQALIPAWRDGSLSPARALLLQDHTHECPACRKALAGPIQPIAMRPRRAAPLIWKWAVAAALVATAGLTTWKMADRFAVPSGPRATVAMLDGKLYRVAGGQGAPLATGAPIAEQENIRTAPGAGATIRLRDGSLVEMRERTQLAVSERRQGVTIRLASGSVIVQAAKQRSRHLYVSTDDCLVSVTGTVFSVHHGIMGSRVAVVEGEVHVTQGDATKVLHPGDQTATSANLTPVAVQDEIAWSRNVDQYVAVLNELQILRKKLEALPGPGLRYSTRLLDLAPQGTVFYAAIPNLGSTLGQAGQMFSEQLRQSEPLRQWWADRMRSADGEAKLTDTLTRVQAFSAYLGPEIALAFAPNATGHMEEAPVLMAEVVRPGLRDFLQQQFQGAPVRIVDDPVHAVPAAGDELYVYIGPNLVAAAKRLPQLRAIAAGQGGFAATPFYSRIKQAYGNGVSWLLCADLNTMVGRSLAEKPGASAGLDKSGFGDAQFLIVERKDISGVTENRAVLTFAQARRGVASWLAGPAPLRSLEFVSADATFATAAVFKNPAALVDDVVAMAGASDLHFASGLAEAESMAGISLREDLARPLGGEFAFAIDGPVLPVPSWKLVLEVNDPALLEQALERLVGRANQEAAAHPGAPTFRIDQEQAGGRTYYALSGTKLPFEAHYVYDGGFLIAAPNRELLLRAIEVGATGNTLPRSAKFLALLPHDGRTDFSAMLYHSLGEVLAPLGGTGVLSPERQKSLAAAAAGAGPTVVLAYGGPDSIELASPGTFFGLRLEQFLGLTKLRTHAERNIRVRAPRMKS